MFRSMPFNIRENAERGREVLFAVADPLHLARSAAPSPRSWKPTSSPRRRMARWCWWTSTPPMNG